MLYIIQLLILQDFGMMQCSHHPAPQEELRDPQCLDGMEEVARKDRNGTALQAADLGRCQKLIWEDREDEKVWDTFPGCGDMG